ncbi:hypothetical protein B0H13DRAFT_2311773 [Mycena leptocephala]|nr:hypothetical protein B0H13DRAFT_2311773 [Mycena leptocephala]
MPSAPKNRRVRRVRGPHHRHFRSAEEMHRDAGLSMYEGPDWPPFVLIPQGPDNPGGWQTARGWNPPPDVSLPSDVSH